MAERAPAAFVVGLPRSGTTMLRLMLTAHPELAIPPETYFVPPARKAWARAGRESGDGIEAVVQALVTHRRWPTMGIDAEDFAARVRETGATEPGDALRCFYELYAEAVGRPRWGDKTPNYARRMRLIHRWLPEARFIHLIRDGRAVARSLLGLWIGPDTIEGCAELWRDRTALARKQGNSLPHYLEVRYEDLVREPERKLRQIAEFLELEYDERMARFHEAPPQPRLARENLETSRRGRPVSVAERRRAGAHRDRPPDPGLIERWRDELSREQIEAFEAIAGDRLRELGYPVP